MAGVMFETLLAELSRRSALLSQRPEGVAFFRVAKDLYQLMSVAYLCTNIPVGTDGKGYVHCAYCDTSVKQFASQSRIRLDFNQYLAGPNRECQPAGSRDTGDGTGPEKSWILTFSLRERVGETALFGVASAMNAPQWEEQASLLTRECQILGNYFHSHVLRMNGHDCERDLLMSARELDCLKWTAEGKTAWEASVILGISERTVRFHLNAAREKLKCATTTQAVAKAVANQLIAV
jgi:DNA-binding CsgD family transcriptional regulator